MTLCQSGRNLTDLMGGVYRLEGAGVSLALVRRFGVPGAKDGAAAGGNRVSLLRVVTRPWCSTSPGLARLLLGGMWGSFVGRSGEVTSTGPASTEAEAEAEIVG